MPFTEGVDLKTEVPPLLIIRFLDFMNSQVCSFGPYQPAFLEHDHLPYKKL